MRREGTNPRVGRRWKIAILAVIVLLGAFFVLMMAVRPNGSSPWLWAFALTIYAPFVLIGAAVLKYLVLLARRARRG
jgi:hypothetical protein